MVSQCKAEFWQKPSYSTSPMKTEPPKIILRHSNMALRAKCEKMSKIKVLVGLGSIILKERPIFRNAQRFLNVQEVYNRSRNLVN